jgi:hypothetical protein
MTAPDRIVDLLPSERPAILARMTTGEQAMRARYFFIARGAGYPEVGARGLGAG